MEHGRFVSEVGIYSDLVCTTSDYHWGFTISVITCPNRFVSLYFEHPPLAKPLAC